MRDYPALGFDPAPGATERVGALAADLGSVATELGAAQQALTSIGHSSGIWQGDAAEAFHDKLGELPEYLEKANRSLGDAARALDQWSADLSSMQRTAARYEAEATQMLQRLQAAESSPDLGLAGQTFPDEASWPKRRPAMTPQGPRWTSHRRSWRRSGAWPGGCSPSMRSW